MILSPIFCARYFGLMLLDFDACNFIFSSDSENNRGGMTLSFMLNNLR